MQTLYFKNFMATTRLNFIALHLNYNAQKLSLFHIKKIKI